MFRIALAGLRRRAGAFVAVLAAVLVGAALLVLCGGLFETGIRLAAPPVRTAGAPVVVIGDADYTMLDEEGRPTTDLRPYPERHRITPDTVQRIARLDEVEAVVPIIGWAGSVTLDGRTHPVIGRNWSAVSLDPGAGAIDGSAPGDDSVAVSEELARNWGITVGRRIELVVEGVRRTVRVAGIVEGGHPTVFSSDDEAVAWTGGDGRVDAVGVVPVDAVGDAASAIERGIEGVSALTGDGRGAAEDSAVSRSRLPAIVTGAVFGGIVLVVLGTVVSATVALSTSQRRRELALLRAGGATTRQLRALVVGETSLVALFGALPGLALGIPLSEAVFATMQSGGLVASGIEMRIGVLPVAVALVVSVLVAAVASLTAARSVSRMRAIEALRDPTLDAAGTGVARWILGILFGLGATALGVLTAIMPPSLVSATGGPAVLAAVIAVALLAPALLRAGLALSKPLARGVAARLGTLAVVNARARIPHWATVTTSVALVVGLGAGNLVSQFTQATAAADAAAASLRADAVLSVPTGVEAAAVDRVRSLDGVTAASRLMISAGWIERPFDPSHRDAPWSLRGVDSAGADVVGIPVERGDLARLEGESVAVPSRTARELGVGIGDQLGLRMGDGAFVEARIVALLDDRPGYESLYLPADLVAAHTDARAARHLLVIGDAQHSALHAAVPNAVVTDRSGVRELFATGLGVQALIDYLLVAIAVAYAAIAVANTVAVSVLSRRREFALQRLTGSTASQLNRMLAAELTAVVSVGVVVGTVAASVAIVPTALAVTGTPFPSAPGWIYPGLLGLVALIVLPVAAAAIRWATRGRPVEVIAEG
ncbi:putative ABC transport system permease protein [Diaminobutyricimonas aerilata]|uniref:Putative ABC transport system permease protein n=1 Tax=Diaminobutyricimonas aerilata TaxID=1162967 RepID=A0A2M9CFI3_9MICO|nr:ABC transporter permease [Diaminobutyricimonas aerilata]PJJ70637.1 putative ABC transport system permease protein [Diaminobutyricimonas aerilata]